MKSRFFWPLAIVLLALPLLWHIHWYLPYLMGKLVMSDLIDQGVLVQGLENAHGWRDVARWWSGSWAGGDQVRFYRPLTSTIWWLEFQLWGGRSAVFGFLATHFLSHFAVCLLLVGWVRNFTSDKIALLCGLLWASFALSWLTLPTPEPALYYWKDDPDIWVSAAIIGALWALLLFLRDGNRVWLAAVFALQIVAIGIKEMAYVLPLLAAALLWHERKGKHWPIVAALFVLVLAAYAFRWWALGGPGFRFGTNGSWLQRWLLHTVGGRPLSMAYLGDVAAMGVASLIWALWLNGQRMKAKVMAYAAFGLWAIVWSDFKAGDAGQTLLRLAQPLFATKPEFAFQFAIDVAITLTIFALWANLWKTRNRAQIFASLWVFLSYLPLMTAPITEHALYLPSIGWALWLAIALAGIWRQTDWRQLAHRLTPQLTPIRKA